MAVQFTFLGHSGFLLSDGRHTLAIDPFLTGNPVAKHTPAQIRCDTVALTHGHADHFGDTLAIAKANDATVVGAFEICEHVGSEGHTKVEPANPGGKVKTDFGWIALTQAFHSSSLDGKYMGMPCGLVVRMGGVTFYHCGDTSLFSDMQLIGKIYGVDVAAVPVGDRFTMGPELGAKAAELIGPKVAIPIHWGTFPMLTSEISAFTPAGVDVKVLEPGQTWEYA